MSDYPEVALAISEVQKSYNGSTALSGVSFSLHRGEHLALLGPNGAGKTTLIKSISGRVRPDQGSFAVFGAPLEENKRSQLGIVPQEIAIYPKLTAKENLEIFGGLYGLQGQELAQRVDWSLNWTDLTDRAHDLAGSFSGGMKRRLNIACGILHSPKIILLDEPTVGVDPQSRERIFEMLAELQDDGVSLLLTTHQLEDAEAHCDRIVIIDHGKVIAQGTRSELIENTIGSKRQMTVTVDKPPSEPLDGFKIDNKSRQLETVVVDVTQEMPPLLQQVEESGLKVEDIEIRAPSLQNVFISLTGRELRE